MGYDQDLADRLRLALPPGDGVSEKRMFGGLAFLVNGNMAISASSQGGLLVRVDPAETEALIGGPHVTRFRMRGRAMDGWLHVDARAVAAEDELRRWAGIGVGYARSLPPKG